MEETAMRTLRAFGETKTVDAWSMDPRAAVWSEAILSRLGEGMSPEEAISRPLAYDDGPVTFLAFGERKTLRDWADDYRCTVSMAVLRSRLRAGYDPEPAMTLPVKKMAPRRERGMVEAFGEWKTVEGWARDARAEASLGILRQRLDNGWKPEEAITRPVKHRKNRRIEAFGETKGLSGWADDPRSRASRMVIASRLCLGWAAEDAITRPMIEMRSHGLTAFGETRTMDEWAEDPRCKVTGAAISNRLKRGLSPEEAITLGHHFPRRLDPEAPEGKGLAAHTRLVTAFGETKSVNAWGRDPRCKVEMTTLRHRILEGWTPEDAITTPSMSPVAEVRAFGETKRIVDWAKDPRCVVSEGCLYQRIKKSGLAPETAMTLPQTRAWKKESHEAFGETKTLREWSEDPRCRVSYATLQNRLSDYGMTFELALISPAAICTKGRYGEMAEAFGERRLLGEWMRDARCVVGRKCLGYRLRAGWELERALTTPEYADRPVGVQGVFYDAFGERKNIRQWSLDSRCAVGESVLATRLKRGWSPERAIDTPALPADYSKGVARPKGPRRSITAFGETKLASEWAKDWRCAVTLKVLQARLALEWAGEDAISIPVGVPVARAA